MRLHWTVPCLTISSTKVVDACIVFLFYILSGNTDVIVALKRSRGTLLSWVPPIMSFFSFTVLLKMFLCQNISPEAFTWTFKVAWLVYYCE